MVRNMACSESENIRHGETWCQSGGKSIAELLTQKVIQPFPPHLSRPRIQMLHQIKYAALTPEVLIVPLMT